MYNTGNVTHYDLCGRIWKGQTMCALRKKSRKIQQLENLGSSTCFATNVASCRSPSHSLLPGHCLLIHKREGNLRILTLQFRHAKILLFLSTDLLKWQVRSSLDSFQRQKEENQRILSNIREIKCKCTWDTAKRYQSTEANYSLWEKSKIRHEVICNRGMATAVKTKQQDSKRRVGNILDKWPLEKMFKYIHI